MYISIAELVTTFIYNIIIIMFVCVCVNILYSGDWNQWYQNSQGTPNCCCVFLCILQHFVLKALF